MGLFDRTRDISESGVGPLSIDIEMARELGWADDDIERAHEALVLIARGAAMTAAMKMGRFCEHCGSCDPKPESLPCGACGIVALLPKDAL